MIKANELRLGNWVKYDNRYFQIHSIADVFPTLNTDEFGIGVVDYNNISPVELTPEILEAAGAKKSVYPHFSYLIEIGEGDRIGLHEYINGWTWFPVAGRKMIVIKHLHQLQNLFYALSGQELEIDVNKLNK